MSEYNTSNYNEQGGARRVVGGSLDVISGGDLDVESGASFKLGGTAVASGAAELDQRVITGALTLGSAGQTYVCSPFTGNVVAVYSVVEGATSDNDDEALTVKDNGGNTIASITIAGGSGAGTVDSDTDTAAAHDDVSAGDMIEIETDGGNDNAVVGNLYIVIQIT